MLIVMSMRVWQWLTKALCWPILVGICSTRRRWFKAVGNYQTMSLKQRLFWVSTAKNDHITDGWRYWVLMVAMIVTDQTLACRHYLTISNHSISQTQLLMPILKSTNPWLMNRGYTPSSPWFSIKLATHHPNSYLWISHYSQTWIKKHADWS